MSDIVFKTVETSAFDDFKRRLQIAFSQAVIDSGGSSADLPLPPDEDLEQNFSNKASETYNLFKNGKRIGGVIMTIDSVSQHNHLDFFFIDTEEHSKGLGFEVWQAIEAKYPETKVWETGTPYFEKRNIHFYVNKCGFQINAFYWEKHPDPNFPTDDSLGDSPEFEDGFFNFIKVMKK